MRYQRLILGDIKSPYINPASCSMNRRQMYTVECEARIWVHSRYRVCTLILSSVSQQRFPDRLRLENIDKLEEAKVVCFFWGTLAKSIQAAKDSPHAGM